jgi:hypothetical protein
MHLCRLVHGTGEQQNFFRTNHHVALKYVSGTAGQAILCLLTELWQMKGKSRKSEYNMV